MVLQHIRIKGFTGEITIVRDYLRQIRQDKKQAFIRFESRPGEQFQIDWVILAALYTATVQESSMPW